MPAQETTHAVPVHVEEVHGERRSRRRHRPKAWSAPLDGCGTHVDWHGGYPLSVQRRKHGASALSEPQGGMEIPDHVYAPLRRRARGSKSPIDESPEPSGSNVP